ncbi:putative armadillo-like helical, pumilio domain-containing protein [Helianthus annuus]|nr:putative armadillo-like helical, pumilio domain-containing protein [Helianthus annuus]KAJ0921716.1 putative armadillo-like helical, pumilio domain-containing protein [Helianthus annuus]
MATESPIRIMEASGKWASPGTFDEIELVMKGQNFQEKQRNPGPNRSGSAPPSMEGSFAAIENLMSRHKVGANDTESEEQLRAHPSYFAYYSSHVNLNPRLPPPIVSDQNRHLFRNIATTTNDPRFTSFDDSTRLTQSNLSTHNEESDDDQSTKQENSLHDDETVNREEDNTGQNLYSNPANEIISNPLEDDISTSADVSSITNRMNAINMYSIPNTESQSQSQWDRQQRSMFQASVPYPQMVSHDQTYVGMNQFLQTPSNYSSEAQRVLQSSGFTTPYASSSAYMMSANHVYPNIYFPQQYTVSGYGYNPPYVSGYLPTDPVHMPLDVNPINPSPSYIGQSQSQHLNKFYGHHGLPIQPPYAESLQLSRDDLVQKQQTYLNPRIIEPASPYYFGSASNMGILQYPNTSYAGTPVPGSPIGGIGFQRNETRSYGGSQAFRDPKTYSFLEELKSGKGRRIELSDIFGHIVEFCGDQHGSRFIQQKLEMCSIEEKESVFKEVLPSASRLITDVFGNYVIQKFFEYGTGEQRRELATQLEGQILPLSLQMYGCRVIQKALDVIELEQKVKLVRELDGHVLRCVHDQNGNHVIQKCIESIPMEKIKFVISSFRGQVAALSMHPYGCRVIQRVLEHSTDELQSQFIVDEILESVYTLAQDQYGNYVTQHVIKRGKPEERSQIVHKLSGRVVQLSQHKFASNVIEKCLEYCDSEARGILIEEIIGLGDDSDNLLAMVKDQFANYVIQKVLQTCTGDQKESLLGRIKIHLNSLKKYTYGKHIVTLFEQLHDEETQGSGS